MEKNVGPFYTHCHFCQFWKCVKPFFDIVFQGLDADQFNELVELNFNLYSAFAYTKRITGRKIAIVKDDAFIVNSFRENRYSYKFDSEMDNLVK